MKTKSLFVCFVSFVGLLLMGCRTTNRLIQPDHARGESITLKRSGGGRHIWIKPGTNGQITLNHKNGVYRSW